MGEVWPKDEVAVADERETLSRFLHHQRRFLAGKADGLTDAQARAETCPPSDLTILGLIRHMADAERYWIQQAFSGHRAQPLFYGDAHPDGDPDGDFHPPPDARLVEALDALWSQAAETDALLSDADLDQIEASERAQYSLRWILVHLIEEYSRHCGHADLLRQAIDGSTGE